MLPQVWGPISPYHAPCRWLVPHPPAAAWCGLVPLAVSRACWVGGPRVFSLTWIYDHCLVSSDEPWSHLWKHLSSVSRAGWSSLQQTALQWKPHSWPLLHHRATVCSIKKRVLIWWFFSPMINVYHHSKDTAASWSISGLRSLYWNINYRRNKLKLKSNWDWKALILSTLLCVLLMPLMKTSKPLCLQVSLLLGFCLYHKITPNSVTCFCSHCQHCQVLDEHIIICSHVTCLTELLWM